MRVLYVDLEREWRGGQSQALLTLCGLRERGHEIELLAAHGVRSCHIGPRVLRVDEAVPAILGRLLPR